MTDQPTSSFDSLRDPVTQLYNRRHLLRRLQEVMARCDRQGDRLAVILWDILGFSEYNNEFGQAAGDELLKKVATTIRQAVRVYDEAFRSGPDEFCALLAPADEKIAGDVMARVKRVVTEALFEKSKAYGEYNFSLIAAVVFYPSEDKLPEALLHAAGQALFQARGAGAAK